MTDEQAHQDTSAETATESISPGRMLREGRERLNLSLEQVTERLHLRKQIIDDLEHDRFDKYVTGTFTRGYLRAYARLVNVDEEQLMAAYESLGVNDKPQDMQSFSRRTRQQSQDNRLMLVTYIVGAVIIGSAIIFWLQNNNDTTDEANTPRPQQSVAERMVTEQDAQVTMEPVEEADLTVATREPLTVDTSLLNSEQTQPDEIPPSVESTGANAPTSQAEANQAQQQIADTALAEQAERAEQVAEQATEQTADNALPEADLVLLFAADTWIRIEDASGEAIAFGVKPEGHISALDGESPYQVTLGAPENVTLYFQGNQIDLSSSRAGRVARLTLPATE